MTIDRCSRWLSAQELPRGGIVWRDTHAAYAATVVRGLALHLSPHRAQRQSAPLPSASSVMVASVVRHDGHVANARSSCVVAATSGSVMFIAMETFRDRDGLTTVREAGSGPHKGILVHCKPIVENAMFTCGQWRDDARSQVRVMRVAPSRGTRGIGQRIRGQESARRAPTNEASTARRVILTLTEAFKDPLTFARH